MSGHSKWSKVKHQKATTDAAKGAAFTKASRAITVAVREGGGTSNPNTNFKLRLAIEKARMVNMPKETITRAIEKGKGSSAQDLSEVSYEGYGPGGVAILVETTTDNKTRTVSAVKHLFDRHGGTLASPGAVNFLFTRQIVFTIPKDGHSFDQLFTLAVDGGASDVIETDDAFEIYGTIDTESTIKAKLKMAGVLVGETQAVMKPLAVMPVPTQHEKNLEDLIQRLADLPDVTQVYTNAV